MPLVLYMGSTAEDNMGYLRIGWAYRGPGCPLYSAKFLCKSLGHLQAWRAWVLFILLIMDMDLLSPQNLSCHLQTCGPFLPGICSLVALSSIQDDHPTPDHQSSYTDPGKRGTAGLPSPTGFIPSILTFHWVVTFSQGLMMIYWGYFSS